MRIVFFGTPQIAVPTLEALIEQKDLSVIACVTQPDRPAGRGQKMKAPPVKEVCLKHNIPVLQPAKLSKAVEVVGELRQMQPDVIVMVAFGQILKCDVLAIPKYGIINLHASLLPAYRGAAPINWSIINGNTVTGITTMFTEAGLDTGPMLLKEEIELNCEINAQELSELVANRGACLVVETLKQLKAGKLMPEKQDDSKATYAPILTRDLGKIDWTKEDRQIHNLVRGLIPWPLAFSQFRNVPVKLWRTKLVADNEIEVLPNSLACKPGAIKSWNKRLFVFCGNKRWLEILEIQPPNKSKMAAKDWLNGLHLESDERFDCQ